VSAPAAEPVRDEHLKELAEALAAVDRATMQLIVDELAEAMPALEEEQRKAAESLREACAALRKPEQLLAELDEELGRVTGQAAEWQGRLSSLRAEDRVEARVRFQAWSEELDRLREKRVFADQDLQPYYDARTKTQAGLELAQSAKRGLVWAMIAPFESAAGQGTTAYVAYRMPRLSYVLLAGDRDHPEWDVALAELEELCLRSAYRTDHLPSNAEQMARSMTAQMPDAAASMADPVPSAVDVIASDAVAVANAGVSVGKSVIEDHRRTPAPPRIVPQRDYMRPPPTARQLGLR
jgi:hypothetical protein